MQNIIEEFNAQQVQDLSSEKIFPEFRAGDTIKVSCKIIEGDTSRTQIFEGVIIGKEKQVNDFNSTVTVRKISHGVGVERKFLIHSPLVQKIEVVKKGIVRRGKLYYLRNLAGKSARIKERLINK